MTALALAIAAPVSAGEVQQVLVANGAAGTRAEVELRGQGEFKTLTLSNPERLVVDLPASSATRNLKLPAGAGIVRSVRTGQPQPGTLRIVFDLAEQVVALKPRVEPSASGARLIIEWPGDGSAPATTAATVAAGAAKPPVSSTASVETAAPAGNPADAARATAALTSQVVLASSTTTASATSSPSAVVPTPVASAASATRGSAPSPQAILNGQATTAAVTSSVAASPVATSTAPPAASAGNYTIATGKPAPVQNTPEKAVTSAPPLREIAAGSRSLVIAIDPGHGGQDSGAVGKNGTYEKNVVLAIGRELARQINATPGMKAYMTRDSDVFIPLPMRARKARAAGADMFVSIHADAAENRSAQGSSVYVLSLKGASSQRARWLADKENASDLIGGVPLQKDTLSAVLLDLAQSGHMKASEDAANHVLDGLKRVGNNHKPHIERANFAVLRTSDMPAMLVETAFISNAEEERRLKDPAYQRKVAGAVLDGVNTYFLRQPPPGTLYAARARAEAQAREVASNGSAGSP
nr:N-acetylmuramoyl-L-alanine amidase [Pseudoxanthomonas dokdonensis]